MSTPGRGFSSPRAVPQAKKKPVPAYELFFKYGGEGGLIRFAHRYSARPWASPLRGQRRRCSKMLPAFLCGQPARRLAVCPTGCASCRPPVGASHPPGRCHRRKKSPYLRTSSSLNMAVRGGFEPPIRCRIHTFQACSFSHSDTSPYCFAAHTGWATGANLGKYVSLVNQLFQKTARLDKLRATCFLNARQSIFLSPPSFYSIEK